MCQFKSAIVVHDEKCKGGFRLLMSPWTESHSELCTLFKLNDSANARLYFARVEFSPPSLETAHQVETYKLRLDEDRAPDWWTDEIKDSVADKMRNYIKSIIVTGDVELLVGGQFVIAPNANVSSAHSMVLNAICGGMVNAICGGTVNAICGGTVNAICGGTVNEIWGGTVNAICGGTVNEICGGTVNAIRGGTVNAIWGGTVNAICGGTVNEICDGTVNEICDGTVNAICGGTVNAIWDGTVNAIRGGTVNAICGGTVNEICGGTVNAICGGTVNAIKAWFNSVIREIGKYATIVRDERPKQEPEPKAEKTAEKKTNSKK